MRTVNSLLCCVVLHVLMQYTDACTCKKFDTVDKVCTSDLTIRGRVQAKMLILPEKWDIEYEIKIIGKPLRGSTKLKRLFFQTGSSVGMCGISHLDEDKEYVFTLTDKGSKIFYGSTCGTWVEEWTPESEKKIISFMKEANCKK